MTASGSALTRNSRSPSSSLMSRQSGDWSPRTPRGRTVGHKTRPRQDSRPAARARVSARVPAGGDTPLGGPVRTSGPRRGFPKRFRPAGLHRAATECHRVLCAHNVHGVA